MLYCVFRVSLGFTRSDYLLILLFSFTLIYVLFLGLVGPRVFFKLLSDKKKIFPQREVESNARDAG